MRFWDLSGPEVEAADAEPWDMSLASAMRPFSTRSLVKLTLTGAFLFGASGSTGIVLALATRSDATDGTAWLAFHCLAVASGLTMVGLLLALTPHQSRRIAPVTTIGLLTYSTLLVSWGVAGAGPSLAIATLAYIQGPMLAFYMMRLRWAAAHSALVLGAFAVVLATNDAWSAPVQTWLFLAGNVIGAGVVMGQIGARADALAVSEHDARVDLADLNQTLEERIAGQVGEIERLGVLRRFLSTQVADVVLADNSTEMSKPHRARIAVFFCDLRGFTAFTNNAEPEEVVDVLDEYYGAIGGLLQRYEATVGDYAGDGIMAYFGDPVPREDSALAAVEMAREVTGVMTGVVAEWQRRGYDLDYGIGVAYGYATLGVVGFDGRYDYKPVGGVMNLAARLCGSAGPGQVLLDHATYAATSERFESAHFADLELKGYAGQTKAYALDT